MMGFGQLVTFLVLITTYSYCTAIECEPGWSKDEANAGTDCYIVINGRGADYIGAQEECKKRKAVLTSVRSLQENDFLKSLLETYIYAYIGGTVVNETIVNWVDGTPSKFQRIPKNFVPNYALVLHKDKGRWNNVLATEPNAFICKATSSGSGGCIDEYQKFEDNCYKYSGDNVLAIWSDAQAACEKDDGNLVSIHSQAENVFLKNTLLEGVVNRAGFTGGRILSQPPAGAAFNWTDGSDNTSFSLIPNKYENGNILILNVSTTRWQQHNRQTPRPYICKRAPGPITEATTTTLEPDGCPTPIGEWSPHGDFCFKLFEEVKHIDNATADCRSKMSELVSIHSAQENEFVKGLLVDGVDQALTGGTSLAVSTSSAPEFVWNDRSEFDFTAAVPSVFTPGQPFLVTKGEKWVAGSTSGTYPYICKSQRGECHDMSADCFRLKNNCLFANFFETMNRICKRTCDFCNCPPDKDEEACRKVASRCLATPDMVIKMVELCPATCKLCGCKDRRGGCVLPGSCSASNAQLDCARTCGLCGGPNS